MCKYKEKRKYRQTDSLLGHTPLPRWLYNTFPLIALFTGLGFLLLLPPKCFSVFIGVSLILYSLCIFYIRIKNKNKLKNML